MSNDWKDPDPGDTRLQAALQTVQVGIGSLTDGLIIFQRECASPLIRQGIDCHIKWVSEVLPSIINAAVLLDQETRRERRAAEEKAGRDAS